jgi:hypothetical protein
MKPEQLEIEQCGAKCALTLTFHHATLFSILSGCPV